MTDPHDQAEQELLDRLRIIVNGAPEARRMAEARQHVPCLFTMPLDAPGRVEWCRIDAGRPHRIHVSQHGVYRWDDDGRLVPTPHIHSPAFRKLYQDDPEGQKPWEPTRDGGNVHDGGVGLYDPPEGLRGFRRFAWHWKAYENLPALQRRVRRLGLLAGFVTGLILTVLALASVVLAILILTWFCLAYWSKWLAA